jgi:hypothetical protein
LMDSRYTPDDIVSYERLLQIVDVGLEWRLFVEGFFRQSNWIQMNNKVRMIAMRKKIIQLIKIEGGFICCCRIDEQVNWRRILESSISDGNIGGGGRVNWGGGRRRNIVFICA